MAYDLIPHTFWRFPVLRELDSLWQDDGRENLTSLPSGLAVSEDDQHVYVEAALPGINPKEDTIDLTYENGVLRIAATSKKSEESARTYYRRCTRQFSYQVAIPGAVDEAQSPEARAEHGVLTVTFPKAATAQPKKISVQS